jgi:hypothetical protein
MKQGEIITTQHNTTYLTKPIKEENPAIIITGSTSYVGQYFVNYFKQQGIQNIYAPTHAELDLTNKQSVDEYVEKTDFGNSKHLIYLPFVAKFKWEPEGIPAIDLNKDGIDDEIFETTCNTFENMVDALEKQINKEYKTLTITNFGSISKGRVPYWQSFDKAHEHNKKFLENKVQSNQNINGSYFFVSSIYTPNEVLIRPNKLPQTMVNEWMSETEIVDAMGPEILAADYKWKEVEIYKFREEKQNHHNNPEELLKIWEQDMGTGSILFKRK